MKITIEEGRSEFSDINTAALYRNGGGIILLHKASTSSTGLEGFTEYDFNFDISRWKFDNILLPNYLDNSTLNMFGDCPGSNVLDPFSRYIFPTISSSENSTDTDKFFGSCTVNNKIVYFIPAPGSISSGNNGVYKIELYEELLTQKELGNPNLIVELGVKENKKENEGEIVDPIIGEQAKLREEISCDKILIVSITQSKGVEVNLSYRAWNIEKDPNRNMNQFVLRNDRFLSSIKSLKTFEEDPRRKLWVDKRNGCLVGTKEIIPNDLPILSRKLNLLSKTKPSRTSYSRYSPYISYGIGDRVVFGKKKFESVSDNNLGNYPTLSPKWILSDYIENIFTSKMKIKVFPEDAAIIIPGGEVTVLKNNEEISFEIRKNLGYELNIKTPIIFSEDVTNTNLSIATNKFSFEDNIFKGWDWSKGISSGVATFIFSEVTCKFYLQFQDPENNLIITNPTTWWAVFNRDKNFIFYQDPKYFNLTFYPNDPTLLEKRKFTKGTDDRAVVDNIPSGQNFYLYLPNFDKYQPKQLIFEETKEVILPIKDDNSWIFPVEANHTTMVATVCLIPKQFRIDSVYDGGFEVDKNYGIIDYGKFNYTLSFYSTNPSLTSDNWVVSIIIKTDDNEENWYNQILTYNVSDRLLPSRTDIKYSYTGDRNTAGGIYKIKLEGDIHYDIEIKLTLIN